MCAVGVMFVCSADGRVGMLVATPSVRVCGAGDVSTERVGDGIGAGVPAGDMMLARADASGVERALVRVSRLGVVARDTAIEPRLEVEPGDMTGRPPDGDMMLSRCDRPPVCMPPTMTLVRRADGWGAPHFGCGSFTFGVAGVRAVIDGRRSGKRSFRNDMGSCPNSATSCSNSAAMRALMRRSRSVPTGRE